MPTRPQTSIAAALALSLSIYGLAGCTPPTAAQIDKAIEEKTKENRAGGGTGLPGIPTGTPMTAPAATPNPSGASPTPIPSTPDTSSRATIHGAVYDDLANRTVSRPWPHDHGG